MVRVLSPPGSPRTSPQASPQDAQPALASPSSKRSAPSPERSALRAKRAKPASKRSSSSRPVTSANRAAPIDCGAEVLAHPPAPSNYTVISEHNSFNDAKTELQLLEDSVHYTVKSNSGKGGRSKLFICRRHQLCGRHARIRSVDCAHGEVKFVLEVGGDHRDFDTSSNDASNNSSNTPSKNSPNKSSAKRWGIHPVHLAEVDAGTLGAGPVMLLAAMKKKYAGQEKLLKALPTEEQIKNRKQQLAKEREKALRIHSKAVSEVGGVIRIHDSSLSTDCGGPSTATD